MTIDDILLFCLNAYTSSCIREMCVCFDKWHFWQLFFVDAHHSTNKTHSVYLHYHTRTSRTQSCICMYVRTHTVHTAHTVLSYSILRNPKTIRFLLLLAWNQQFCNQIKSLKTEFNNVSYMYICSCFYFTFGRYAE